MENVKRSNVAIVHEAKECESIKKGLDMIKLKDKISESDVVVITPNWVNPKKPDPVDAVVVGQESLRALIQAVRQQNPKKVVIATGSAGGDTKEVMKKVGYDKILDEEHIQLIDLNQGPYVEKELEFDAFNKIKLHHILDEMTVLISFTQLKYHEEATISGCIKNIGMGWPPSAIHGTPKKDTGIHDDLHNFLRAMAKVIPIDIAVLSTNPVMIGSGPTKGIARHTGIVVVGDDALSVDVVGARFLGLKPQGVNYLFQCEQLGYGISKVEEMNLMGLPLIEAEKIFSEAAYGERVVIDAN